MADLTDQQAAETIKITGADSSGVETNYTKVSSNQDLGIADIVDTSYVSAVITVGTSAVAAKVGASNLSSRKALIIYNDDSKIIYHGPSTVAISGSNKGIPIAPGEQITINAGPNVTVYLISASSGLNIIIQEMA